MEKKCGNQLRQKGELRVCDREQVSLCFGFINLSPPFPVFDAHLLLFRIQALIYIDP